MKRSITKSAWLALSVIALTAPAAMTLAADDEENERPDRPRVRERSGRRDAPSPFRRAFVERRHEQRERLAAELGEQTRLLREAAERLHADGHGDLGDVVERHVRRLERMGEMRQRMRQRVREARRPARREGGPRRPGPPREQSRPPRERRDGDRPRPGPEEARHRVERMREAAEHPHAAGLHEMADELIRRLDRIQREFEQRLERRRPGAQRFREQREVRIERRRPGPSPRPRNERRFDEIHERLNHLDRRLDEIHEEMFRRMREERGEHGEHGERHEEHEER